MKTYLKYTDEEIKSASGGWQEFRINALSKDEIHNELKNELLLSTFFGFAPSRSKLC